MKLTELFLKQKKEITSVTPISNTRFISPAFIIRMIIGIVLLIVLAHVGFYKTYIRHFPGFEDNVRHDGRQIHFTWVMHFHGMMMIGWLLMLLVQPIFILKGKVKLHRIVGRLSYVLAPLVLITMYLVTRGALDRVVVPEEQATLPEMSEGVVGCSVRPPSPEVVPLAMEEEDEVEIEHEES